MSTIDENDLFNYFKLYEEYQQTEDKTIQGELDKKLTKHKDTFHKHPDTVLKILSERKNDFTEKYKTPYQDLVFDLEMHAKTMEAIRRTHKYDSERDIWVPKTEVNGNP